MGLFFGDSVGHNKKHIFKEEFITLLGSRILQQCTNHLGKMSGKFISVKAWLWKTGEAMLPHEFLGDEFQAIYRITKRRVINS